MPWKAGSQLNLMTHRGSDFSSKLERALGRVGGRSVWHAIPPRCSLLLSCGNGDSNFNVVIYVTCLEQCVLDCISSQRAHVSPPPDFVRGGVKSLLTLWPCWGVATWSEPTNCWMLGSICWCCHFCAFCSKKAQSPPWLTWSRGGLIHAAVYKMASSLG